MTSIKIFKNHESQNLENDVNKFLQGYEKYITNVSLMTYIKDSSPIFVALVTILEEKRPTANVESATNK